MKTIRATLHLFSAATISFLIFSCNNKAPNNSEEKKDTTVNQKLPGSSLPKEATVPEDKKVTANWIANAAKANVAFSVKGPFGMVHGNLSGLNATIAFDENNLNNSFFRASVDSRSITTGNTLRNRDIQKSKYLDTQQFPLMSFKSTQIQKSGTGWVATGALSIKGVTKTVEIPFNFSGKGNTGLFKGSFSIQREDYGIGKSGGLIGDKVSIDLEVPVTK